MMVKDVKALTSIVILSLNTLDHLRRCVESIRKYTATGTYELIVVDNGSTDGSVPWIIAQPDIKQIINEKNEGFPKGCNQGMAIARGTEILLLNSDVIVTPLWLSNMREVLYMENTVGAVSCVTNYCSNGQQIEVPAELHYDNVAAIAAFGEKYNKQIPQRISFRNALVGFCFLFRASLYHQLGGLDEAFSPGNYEDDDYSLRILQAGYKLICCEDTFIYHVGSASFVQTPEKRILYEQILKRNEALFFSKWHVPRDYRTLSTETLREWLSAESVDDSRLGGDDGSAVVVIPVYKEKLSPEETISLTQARRVFSAEKIVFAAPQGFYPDYGNLSANIRVEHFPSQCFTSVLAYSQLCLLDEFYARFSDYEYMLMYQLDAFVFTDRLAEFCALGVDYIGTPIPQFYNSWHILLDAQVGNGGFSLRRIAAVRQLLQYKKLIIRDYPLKDWLLVNEDMFFAYCGEKMYFQVADVKTALNFAVQDDVCNIYKRLSKKLPFGVHGWHSCPEVWREHIEKAGYQWPDSISNVQPNRRRQIVEDYLRGRGNINTHYLYLAIKWQEPLRALRMVLDWLSRYPCGDKVWQYTTEVIMCLWARCIIESKNTEAENLYLYEMLEKALGKAFIRSYYVENNDAFVVKYFEFTNDMLRRQNGGGLVQEMEELIKKSVRACENTGNHQLAAWARNAYKKLFCQ